MDDKYCVYLRCYSLKSSSKILLVSSLVSNYFPTVHRRYSGKLSKVLFFADDLKLFISVTSSEDIKLLCSDLDLLLLIRT